MKGAGILYVLRILMKREQELCVKVWATIRPLVISTVIICMCITNLVIMICNSTIFSIASIKIWSRDKTYSTKEYSMYYK